MPRTDGVPRVGCVLVLVGLALNTQRMVRVFSFRLVGFLRVPEHAVNVLNAVPQIERYVEHLLHLSGVYTLMVNHFLTDYSVATHEQDTKQVDSLKTWKGDDVVSYYFHVAAIKFIGKITKPLPAKQTLSSLVDIQDGFPS